HRHGVERIVPFVDGEKDPQVTQPAEPVERDQPPAQKAPLFSDTHSERTDLSTEIVLLLHQVRLEALRDLQLAGADPELQIDRLQLLLRGPCARMKVFELLAEMGDLAADASEVGVGRGRGVGGKDAEQREQKGRGKGKAPLTRPFAPFRGTLSLLTRARGEGAPRADQGPEATGTKPAHASPPAAVLLSSTIPLRGPRGFPHGLPR